MTLILRHNHYYENIDGKEVCIDDEIPFEIPQSWRWVRLGNIFNMRSAMRIHQSDWKSEGIPFYRGRELVQLSNTGKTSPEVFLSPSFYQELKDKGGVPSIGDILISAVGTIGKTYIVTDDRPFYYKDAYILCFENYANLFSNYFQISIASPYLQSQIKDGSEATTVSQLTLIKANSLLCPIPPEQEQKRICECYNKISSLIFDYSILFDSIVSLDSNIEKSITDAIVQYAIQGKLVSQKTDEESVKIQCKNPIIRRDNSYYELKNDIEIQCSNIPFLIPLSWKWIKLSDLVDVKEEYSIVDGPFGSDLKKEHYTDKKEVRIIQLSNLGDGYWKNENCKYTTFEHAKELERCLAKPGDLVIAKMMPAGRTSIIPSTENDYILSSDTIKFIPNPELNKQYLLLAMNSQMFRDQIAADVHGITRVRTSVTKIRGYVLPIPPIEEQDRIVERVNILLSLTNQLSD
ncbi:MAG: hypothetical protein E7Z62_05260 [Thermoplasmata archaeon]|nr:hypothetical protein [Thermoplasmata archaeon]